MADHRVHTRTCTLCEAGCALEIGERGDGTRRVRGDRRDVLSAGYLCPKGSLYAAIDRDPDRLHHPLVRRDGVLCEASWDEAFAVIGERIPSIIERDGRDAVALFIGNPTAHNLSASLYLPHLLRVLGTRNCFSPASIDSWPEQVASLVMFGNATLIPVPDVERTELLVVIGANPRVSNGSMATLPNWPGHLDGVIARGGRVVVIDPRRTETARHASTHLAIRPGTDAFLLLAVLETLFADGLTRPGRLAAHLAGLDALREFVRPFSPERVAPVCGIDPEAIRQLATDLSAQRSAVYGRVGANLQEHGLVVFCAINAINVLCGSLDEPGGVVLPLPVTGHPAARVRPRGVDEPAGGRWRSRVSGRPEFLGELPVVTLREEIATPGAGQIRALIVHSGNPVVSLPNGRALGDTLPGLEFMVSVDIYVNETSRHADVVLPAPPLLSRSYYPFIPQHFGIRAYAKFSAPLDPMPDGMLDDWELILRLAAAVEGDLAPDVAAIDDRIAERHAGRLLGALGAGAPSADDVLAASRRRGPERLLDLYVRAGPYGDHFGAVPGGLTLDEVAAAPHGLDLGPPPAQFPGLLRTASGRIDLLPAELTHQAGALAVALDGPHAPSLVLIGRRQLQSNNSWMHNLPKLVGGRNRCTVHVHPLDAAARGIVDGAIVAISTSTGSVTAPCEITTDVPPGVVSMPHGWGHERTDLGVAARLSGVSVNDVIPEGSVERVTAAAAVNGVAVTLAAHVPG